MPTGDTNYIYRDKMDRACFQHDMAYGDLKRWTQSDKVLKDKAFEIASNPKCDGCQRYQWFINFLIKNQKKVVLKNDIKPNQQLPNELDKPIIRKFKKSVFFI